MTRLCPALLFNCCTGFTAPDWRFFSSLEIGACLDHDGETEGGLPFDVPGIFFSIYGRRHDGEAEAITDIHDPATVLLVAAELARASGLPVMLYHP